MTIFVADLFLISMHIIVIAKTASANGCQNPKRRTSWERAVLQRAVFWKGMSGNGKI